ncbi:hypothetical protein WICPIJ_008674 [Wickerhamomyces pijperi]|uniref:Uncharacterized protein n=1 Tax=Wickerhamomyces pijperi TaxID=599730 RepID=A0A9P8PVK4_WICPI|nr:hypothetical protein WICPIJ_008674 [Wickerhamomyces pijperi]
MKSTPTRETYQELYGPSISNKAMLPEQTMGAYKKLLMQSIHINEATFYNLMKLDERARATLSPTRQTMFFQNQYPH